MLKRLKVSVRRSELQTTHTDIPAWELPVLRVVYPEKDAVQVLGEIIVNREPPVAQAEFERLQRRYGRIENDDGSKGAAYVDAVFGQFGVGTANLEREIAKAVVQQVEETADDNADLI